MHELVEVARVYAVVDGVEGDGTDEHETGDCEIGEH